MMNKLVIFTCLAITLTTGSIASAIPEWRGDPGSTYQEWYFDSSNTEPVPNVVNNPYGDPLLRVTPHGGWISNSGAWALSGEIDVMIPNYPQTRPEKWIQIQLTWQPVYNDSFLPSEPLVGAAGIAPSGPYKIVLGPRTDSDAGGGWTQSTYDITIQPNPLEEWIAIKGDILVDELIIDTICVPEPATICLFGLGALTLLRRKAVTGRKLR